MSLDEMMASIAVRERQEEVARLMRARSAGRRRQGFGRVTAAGLRRLADLVDPESRNGSLTPIAGSR